jgi:hypothetical protein
VTSVDLAPQPRFRPGTSLVKTGSLVPKGSLIGLRMIDLVVLSVNLVVKIVDLFVKPVS